MSTPTLERPTIGSLCSGYGGLDLAVEGFFGARTAWFSEFDPAPSKVLAHHWPTVPNLGDMTRIDWGSVDPVDIIAGGTPCQDLSGAGRRAGMTEGTRSNLWVQMREAIAVIRPRFVVWENVRGAYSAYAVSEVESETGLLGGYGPDRPALRALGRVLGDLSDLGYDTQWVGVRASDVGAPHGRFRVFVLAHAEGDSGRFSNRNNRTTTDTADFGHERAGNTWGRWDGLENHRHTLGDADIPRLEGRRIPTERRSERTAGAHDLGTIQWGVYEPAIRRWEQVLGRSAPAPTEPTGKGGAHRLSPTFVEWMMGAESGWVTDPEIGLTRNQQLKALGNGVVSQQAEYALSLLFARVGVAA